MMAGSRSPLRATTSASLSRSGSATRAGRSNPAKVTPSAPHNISGDGGKFVVERIVIFGATGDLTGRYLIPALARLYEAGRLPSGIKVTGIIMRHYPTW